LLIIHYTSGAPNPPWKPRADDGRRLACGTLATARRPTPIQTIPVTSRAARPRRSACGKLTAARSFAVRAQRNKEMIGELADTITSGFDQETNDVQATLAAPSV